MENIETFVEKLVDIQYLSNFEMYGHYPFQMLAKTKDGKFEMNALLLGGDVMSVYRRAKHYIYHAIFHQLQIQKKILS